MLRLECRTVAFADNAAALYRKIFYGGEHSSFWLDSSAVIPGFSRYSYLGNAEHGEVLTYDVRSSQLTIVDGAGTDRLITPDPLPLIWRRLRELEAGTASDLPFPFRGGFVGYFGYEFKSVTIGQPSWPSAAEDVALILARRFIAIDHQECLCHVVAIFEPQEEAEAIDWLHVIAQEVTDINGQPDLDERAGRQEAAGTKLEFRPRFDRMAYLQRIEAALEAIAAGESYEVCLTNQFSCNSITCDPLSVYLALRRNNPAPYGAYLDFDQVSVACSSPERFLTISRDGWVESKPMKGTIGRSADPVVDGRLARDLQEDEKTQSENLMITDLVRNDLGRVCKTGSVHVPKLMAIESYRYVHQMVTTVRGQLDPQHNTLDCLKAAFPGGSMTGAPKFRTLEIIDTLEGAPRGIYSGCIGWIGADGAADLNIVIRTIILSGSCATIGVGGAIVALSDPLSEFEETLLKARASLRALAEATTGDPEAYGLVGVEEENIEVGPAVTGDVPFVLDGITELMRELTCDPTMSLPTCSQGLLGSIVAGESSTRLLVARDRLERHLVGFISWSVAETLRSGGRQAMIEELWVKPAYRSRGIGQRLVESMAARCGALGIRRLEVGLPKDSYPDLSRTQRFYASNGFVAIGPRMRRVVK